MWDWFLTTIIGWDYLTPQGIRLGIASFMILGVAVPVRSTSAFDWLMLLAQFTAIGTLVAQAVSLGQK